MASINSAEENDHNTYVSPSVQNGGMSIMGGMSTMGGGGEYIDLHEVAKGWKAAVARTLDPATREESMIKNDRGNLPLHSAASFRAPVEVIEALLDAYPEAASATNNYGNLALHFTAWKKGPLDSEKLLLQLYPEGAAQKNNHGNLPLHYAAHYNAPLEVVEALYNAFPDGALQKNNDNNTPLDLAIADGASPNVVALLQGKSIPPTDDEVLEGAKSRCERMEKELQRSMEGHDGIQEDLESTLSLLMDVKDRHPHALYSAGIDPTRVFDLDSLLEQVRNAGDEDRAKFGDGKSPDEAMGGIPMDEDAEAQLIEDALVPPDDDVEIMLSKVIGLDAVKNQIRGLRRSIEMDKLAAATRPAGERSLPRHIGMVGGPGTGKTFIARLLIPVLYKIGAVKTPNFVEAGREDLVDRKSEARTITKTRRLLDRASGGVLFLDEVYSLLPSPARARGRDHGAAALREICRGLSSGSPLVIMTGYSADMQKLLVSDIGFKGKFLTRMEFPDSTPSDLSHMFFARLAQKGLVTGNGVTPESVALLMDRNTDEAWRSERNGRIADLLIAAVRIELRKRVSREEMASKGSTGGLKSPMVQRMPTCPPEELVVTIEDIQNAITHGF
uniref:AAA+ ATPase domain-containing protein n=1 Tax=Attheya septentrionalis TaxID=420275 RepID=A0A7S2UJ49_9STRA|mmetsp:Transcript_24699/g.44720  ORF Transcript_24699/g.44720 Transcript_24699/m.44720 type:complete len:615 (+) Transcript_24699:185-2029(+)|eukprot:CAMPEP_0198293606 /NCGR_PEP_ID=MMETSP1449-20131203/17974_1 /TAXON_ID=420275 /ORGANISM="Attheya septentrionalis, Strain CCMP2084" /LENGTH=614 /DNA_ID=CAMNT_0043993249 /DNA_START=111 /DNA_END=1955 /DNA_ORIENTATION=-